MKDSSLVFLNKLNTTLLATSIVAPKLSTFLDIFIVTPKQINCHTSVFYTVSFGNIISFGNPFSSRRSKVGKLIWKWIWRLWSEREQKRSHAWCISRLRSHMSTRSGALHDFHLVVLELKSRVMYRLHCKCHHLLDLVTYVMREFNTTLSISFFLLTSNSSYELETDNFLRWEGT